MNEQIRDLLHFYALGAVTEEERLQVERYLAQHPQAQAWLDELQTSLLDIPQEVTPVTPSPHVKAQLMARVKADAQARAAVARRTPVASRQAGFLERLFAWRLSLTPAMAALGVAVLLAAGLLSLFEYGQATTLRQTLAARESEIMALQTDNDDLLDEVARLNETVRVQREQLKEKDVRIAALTGENAELTGQVTNLEEENGLWQDELAAVRGELAAVQSELEAIKPDWEQDEAIVAILHSSTATWTALSTPGDPSNQLGFLVADLASDEAVFIAYRLEPLQGPTTYQLWLIQGDQYTNVGQFENTGTVQLIKATATIGTYGAAGVSLEPGRTPSATPTDVKMVGFIS
ncbi:MAG: anti-sigma factor [Chloroflexota bacterium]